MSLRRILLLGGTGKLGASVARAAGETLHVALHAPSRAELDLASASGARWDEVLGSGLYDVVLNCAAAANVDACEADAQTARAVNAEAPGRIAAACARAGLPFIHVSTDYVFGGPAAPLGPFAEDAKPGPAQRYGQSKWEGEQAVLAASGRRTVARVSWLFGPGQSPFSDFVLRQARDGVVRVFDQASRPTWLPGLARWMVGLGVAMVDGAFVPSVLHPAGGPWASRLDWARAVLDAHGLDVPVELDASPHREARFAPRPRDSRLDSARTDAWNDATWSAGLPDWREHVG